MSGFPEDESFLPGKTHTFTIFPASHVQFPETLWSSTHKSQWGEKQHTRASFYSFYLLDNIWRLKLCFLFAVLTLTRLPGADLRYESLCLCLHVNMCLSCLWQVYFGHHYDWWGLWLPYKAPRPGGLWRGQDNLPVSIHRQQVQPQVHHHSRHRLQGKKSGKVTVCSY